MRPVGIKRKMVLEPGCHQDLGSAKEQARREEAARIKRLKRAGKGKIYGKSIVTECQESIELVNDLDPYRDAMQDAGRGRLLP